MLGIALFAAYLAALPALRIVPRHHWGALLQIVRAQFGRREGPRRRRAKGRSTRRGRWQRLDDADRVALRIAIVKGKPVEQVPERLANRGLATNGAEGAAGGGALVVGALRRAADEGGTPIREGKKAARRWGSPAERDAEIADYLFPQGTVAQRDAHHAAPPRRGRPQRRADGARGGPHRARERPRRGLEGPVLKGLDP